MLLSIASPFYVSMARITMKNLPDLARFQRRSHADSTFLAGVSDAVSTRMRCEASSYTKRLRAKFASEAFICENERASHAKHSCRLPRRGGVFL